MKKLILLAALAAGTATLPATSPAQAQTRSGVLVVDTDQILGTCTACRAAAQQLQQREATLRTRAQTLSQQLETEGKPIQTAIDALKGRQPDAALQQRITAFQTRQQNAQQEIANGQRELQSIASHVNQQVGRRLVQIVEASRARRGAAVVLSKNSTLANDSTVDITGEVLAALNQQLPAVSVTPLPQQQQQPQQQRPQGR
ncbi:MAG TPA: OmpH family outer membrane protein [Sphingomicrobium sp.]|nr:OmpH family outer membrane protein [Sphingomicrobium sp.]